MRRLWILVLGLLVLVVVAGSLLSTADPRRDGPTGDPRATTPAGTRAAVLLAESLGYDTSTGSFSTSASTVVVFHDDVEDELDASLDAWVSSGGVLLALGAEVEGLTAPRTSGNGTVDSAAACDLGQLSELEPPDVGLVPSLSASAGDRSCFGVDDGSFVVVATRGAGTVVSVSSSRPFQNGRLDDAEHAALFDGLLSLSVGRLLFVTPTTTAVGGGDQTLSSLVPEWMWVVLALGLAGGAVHMIAAARRHGRPVPERTAVEIDGSELIRATARHYERSDARSHGVEMARAELRRELMRRWSGRRSAAPDDAAVDEWIRRLRLSGGDADTLRQAMTAPVTSDGEFVSAMQAITVSRQLIARGGAIHGSPPNRSRTDRGVTEMEPT